VVSEPAVVSWCGAESMVGGGEQGVNWWSIFLNSSILCNMWGEREGNKPPL
jgi:hypothetical protein